jgi:hypothetical protein
MCGERVPSGCPEEDEMQGSGGERGLLCDRRAIDRGLGLVYAA